MSAVIYVRVSTTEQVENYSLGWQERACRAFCAANGHEVDRVFVEEGASAKTSNRPQLQAMLTYCEKNGDRIDLVVVYKVDRLARNVEDHVAIKAALARCAVMLAAAAETFDDSPMGNFFETVMAGVAQVDNDMRAKKTRDGMVAALRDGRWVHQAPLGYVKPTSKTGPSLVPDPDSAFFVREAFQRASLWAEPRERIRRDLVERGFTTPRGKAVSAQSFTNMLKNPTYHGRMLVGGSINFDGRVTSRP